MKKFKIFAIASVSIIALALMSFVKPTDEGISFRIPRAFETKVYQLALDNNAITESERDFLLESNAAQRCFDKFMTEDIQASVNELATIAVESGKFQTTDQAKRAIKKNIEVLRKKDSTWRRLYSILGL